MLKMSKTSSDTRTCQKTQEVNTNTNKPQELLNRAAIHCLQSRGLENHIEAPASLVTARNLAKLVTNQDDESEDASGVHEAMKFTRRVLEGKSDLIGNEVNMFHNIWLRDGLRLNKNVRRLIAKYYGCEIRSLPIVNHKLNVTKLRKKLQKLHRSGRFAKDISRTVFRDVFPQDILLTCGFYIEMQWREHFTENLTTKEKFFSSEYESVVVETMVLRCGLVCANCDNINAKVLELPLTAHNVSMLVLLPQDKRLDYISKNLTPETFENLMEQLRSIKAEPVHATLPKFSLQQFRVLPSATLSETEDTSGQGSHRISAPDCRIFQTSTISINEYGINTVNTRQSDATITGPAVHGGIKWTYFTANSPFLFMVVDMEYRLIFMAGKVTRPDQTNDIVRQSSRVQKTRSCWCCI